DEEAAREDGRREEDEALGDEDRPDEEGEVVERDPRRSVAKDRDEEVDRARGGRDPEQLEPDDPHVDAGALVVHTERRVPGPPDVRGPEPHDYAGHGDEPE